MVSSDRKSTRLNSSHVEISYAVFCLKKKKKTNDHSSRYVSINSSRRERRSSVVFLHLPLSLFPCVFFFFNDTATTEIYTLSLHDALPILRGSARRSTSLRPPSSVA